MTHSQPNGYQLDGTARIGSVLSIPAVLSTLGLDPARVLAEAGVDLKLFDNPDNVITFSSRAHLIEVCTRRTGCKHFGLLISKNTGLSAFGLVGYFARHSPQVGLALRNFIYHFHLHVQGALISLTEVDDLACLTYSTYQPLVEAREQIENGAVAIAFNIMNELCGENWQPVEVCFAHRKPKNIEPFRHFFKSPLHFDAEQNGIWFPARWLKKPVSGNDPELYRILKKQIGATESAYRNEFPDQVRRVMQTALLTGKTRADQVAALFSMHCRTFNRRLKTYNTSFKEIADQTRFEIAQQLLADSALEMIQIATTLGYADASAFTRAFKRWSGTTPSVWRDNQTSIITEH